MDLTLILQAVLAEYRLPLNGDHGVAHWARVLFNGRLLASETGANPTVVELFAVLHDSRRVNEMGDPQHGVRAAEFASTLRGTLIQVSDQEFAMLHRACAGHTVERDHPDVTIQTCWDADRLDLGRVGITPHPSRLCTPVAKRDEILREADRRAIRGLVPELVRHEWGIDLNVASEW
ncbi:MAG: hypothetical protein R3B96_12380 [Pirellulaceae bacterium]